MGLPINQQGEPLGISGAGEATVLESELIPDTDGAIFGDGGDLFAGLFNNYTLRNHFKFTQHVLPMPVAGPSVGTKTEFICVAAPTATMRVEWHASRQGAKPPIPYPHLSDSNLVLIDSDVSIDNVEATADGDVLFIIGGEHLYGFVDPSMANLYAPVPPYIDGTSVQDSISFKMDTFAGNITEPGGVEGAAGAAFIQGGGSTGGGGGSDSSGFSGGGANAV